MKNDRKIDIISGIDEEIIDRNTAKRIEYKSRQGRPPKRKGYIAVIAIAAVIALLGSLVFTLLIPQTGQTPVYIGMSVASADGADVMYGDRVVGLSAIELLDNDNTEGNNGNHGANNPNKKPIDEIIKEDAEYPDEAVDSSDGSLEIIRDEGLYYAKPGEEIYITVHFHNPDDYTITAFKINGIPYASYMFEDGSDMENIIIKVRVPENAEGIVDYTIDSIQYIDRETPKYVVMNGDPTLSVGVYTERQPSASVTNEVIGINELAFDVDLTDELSLIALFGGNVQAVITDGNEILEMRELKVGESANVRFEGLKTSSYYNYAIVATYDALDGEGFVPHVIFEKEIITREVVAFTDLTVGKEGVNFNFVWNESAELREITSITLFCGDEKVLELDVASTAINGLLSDTEYRLVVNYRNKDGIESIEQIFKTDAKNLPEIEITSPTRTQTSIGFDVIETDTDEVGAISKIELYLGEALVKTADSTDLRNFDGLLSNNKYTVKLTYVYDLCDGKGEQTLEKAMDITTDAKATPVVEITNSSKTQTSIGFDVIETDTDEVGAISKIELYLGETLVKTAESVNVRGFDGLLSNNKYTVKLTYVYDLCDGNGSRTVDKTLAVVTDKKAEPIFNFKNVITNVYSVDGEYEITNIDSTLISYDAGLFKGDSVIAQINDGKFSVASLDSYTEYTAKVTYKFDVNDGKGVQEKSIEYRMKTLPYVGIKKLSVRNTTAVSSGDVIYLQANIDNPNNVDVTYAVVNGIKCAVSDASTAENIFVEIVCDDNLGGGEIALRIEGLSVEINDESYDLDIESDKSADVFINGTFELISVEFVDYKYEPKYWRLGEEELYLKFTVDNSTDYKISQIIISICGNMVYIPENDIIKVSDTEYVVDYSKIGYTDPITEVYVSFANQYVSKTVGLEGVDIRCVFVSDEIKYISTGQELIEMLTSADIGGYYELTADIDLSGMELPPSKDFYGVLNGNGYAIKNISVVGTQLPSRGIGLFDQLYGVVSEIRFENVFILATLSDAHCGIIAEASRGKIVNCTIDETSMISVTGATCAGGLVGEGDGLIKGCTNYGSMIFSQCRYAGSIAGSVTNADVEDCKNYGSLTFYRREDGGKFGGIAAECETAINCVNYGDITVRSESSFNAGKGCVGGIAGHAGSAIRCINYGNIEQPDELKLFAGGITGSVRGGGMVKDCINYGKIVGNGGGIVGSRLFGSGTQIISNCFNAGEVIGDCVGGIFYHGGTTELSVYVENCVNIGKIESSRDHADAGIISGSSSRDIDAINCYTNVLYTRDANFDDVHQCSTAQLNSKEFYTKTLGWSEDVWDFSDLDFENGKYPKLK